MQAATQSGRYGATSPIPSPLAEEIIAGLTQPQKVINPKFFYDQRGSELFDQITALPEYYPTRTEMQILRSRAGAIAEYVGPSSVVVEPGAGSCEKIRTLLHALKPAAYVPQDISADFLAATAAQLETEFPSLNVQALAGDFADFIELPDNLPETRRVLFYPGSTLGNFEPAAAAEFLSDMRKLLGSGAGFVVGVDLQKDDAILNAAYNDSAGVTARFNLNALHHINTVLGSHIDVAQFRHHAFYNSEKSRIEMHLVSRKKQQYICCGEPIEFEVGESILTEYSYKYTKASFAFLAESAGLRLVERWVDDEQLFSVNYLEA